MARIKNALRGHFVAAYTDKETKPTEWLELAHWITDVTDDSDENVEEYADYAGDGNPASDVVSISEKWTFEGTYDPEDAAQKFIADMKRLTGDGRRLWHKIVQTDGGVFIGPATASEIKAGGGNAAEYEAFGCVLNFNESPTKEVTP